MYAKCVNITGILAASLQMLASDDNIIHHCLDIGLLWEHQQQLHRRRGGESSARNSVSKNLTGE